jgi:hypothetical protein
VRRVHAGVRRSRLHRASVVAGVAAAGSVAGVALAAGGGDRPVELRQGTPPVSAAPSARGPGDDELRVAQWFSYSSVPAQPEAEREPEQRWEGRDGRHLARQPDGSVELYSEQSRFPYADGLTWDELLALPADPARLAREMGAAQGDRPAREKVVDQVKQLLGRSPALLPVRRALLEAALRQEGATLVDGAQDSRGREALLLELTDRDRAVVRLFVDPASYRLLEERLVAGPGFPAPPTDGPVPSGQPSYRVGQELYREVFLSWTTEAPPA